MSSSVSERDSQEKHISPSQGTWGSHYWRLTLGLILLVLGPAFEELAVPVTLPTTVANLGGLRFYGWTFSIFMLTTLIGIVWGGEEADKRGLVRTLIIGIIFFDLGLLIAGLAPSIYILLLGRAIQGFGGGALGSLANTSIGRGYPEKMKPKMLAILSTAFILPGIVGPTLAATTIALVGWRWVFLGLVPLCPLALLLIIPSLKSDAIVSTALDLSRIFTVVLLALGTGMILLGVEVQSLLVAILLVVSGFVLAGFTLHRLLPPGTLRAKAGLPTAIITIGLLCMGYFGERAFLPLVLTSVRAQSEFVAGVAVTAATLTWTAGAWIQARLSSRKGRRVLVISGLILLIIGIAGTTSIRIPSVPILVILVSWAVGGLGMGIAYSTTNLVVLETAPPDQVGYASASMQLAVTLGIALGTGLEGIIFGSLGRVASLNGGIVLVNALFLSALILTILTATRLPNK